MKAAFLVKIGSADKAFEIRETDRPKAGPQDVEIKVQAFGLNFADVMARLGLYPDAPPKPAILGYDVVGHVSAIGKDVDNLSVGQRVIALTRFGGYAEYAETDFRGVVPIDDATAPDIATALATQGGTAYYMAKEMVNIVKNDQVLVHAAAGGVGSILVQLCKSQGAIVYGTAGSDEKIEFLRENGVDHPIKYRNNDFARVIRDIQNDTSNRLDIIFDPVGGKSVSKGMKLLGSGGRMVLFGASALTSAKTVFHKLGVAMGFGLYSPISLLTPSKSIIAVNMLRIADDKPEMLQRVLEGTVSAFNDGKIRPKSGGVFSVRDLGKAHDLLGSRKTMGKLAIVWD